MTRRRAENILAAPSPWLTPFLIPLSVFYSWGAALHRGLYLSGVRKAARLPKPVVSVGNMTAGGGGKTPVVMWLSRVLSDEGLCPAILTRGYGRTGSGIRIVEAGAPWQDFGDEPFLMASKLNNVPVAVSGDRHRAGSELLRTRDVDLFLLDDGFQHRALHRDLDIVVVDSERRFGNGRQLPAGILREPLRRLEAADFIVVTRAETADPEFERVLEGYSTGPVLWADYKPGTPKLVRGAEPGKEGAAHNGPFTAFCGIAGPEGFRRTLDRAGLEVTGMLTFPDHHPYDLADREMIVKKALDHGSCALITTEKDAVRWPEGAAPLPLYTLPVELTVKDHGEMTARIRGLAGKAAGD